MVKSKKEKKDDSRDVKQFELALNTSAFLGGLTFAAMVFVMQAKEDFIFLNIYYYPDILITCLAAISFTFILSSIGHLDVASGFDSAETTGSQLGLNMTLAAWIAVMAVIPFLLLPFTWIGAAVVGILELVVGIRYLSYPTSPPEIE